MTIGLKYLRVFWLTVLLVVAGGQLAHAWNEYSCAREHQQHEHSETSKNCPTTGHECCQSHLQAAVDLTRGITLPGAGFVSVSTHLTDDASIEGHREKIEYPPRLS